MRALLVYESMYGNTHAVASAIGDGLRAAGLEVDVVPVDRAGHDLVSAADLVVVGGPTHGHGMSRAGTREAAIADARKVDSPLVLDPDAEGPGLREWLDAMPALDAKAAAFDTRVDLPAVLTGRASKGIGRQLHHHGLTLVADPESFLVTTHNELESGEATRAQAWGAQLAARLAAASDQSA